MQYGFYIDQTRCIGCHACVVACKDRNDILPGPLALRKLYAEEQGTFPNSNVINTTLSCNHCAEPACIPACTFNAIYKDDKFGAVVVDRNKCQGAGSCITECPYKAIDRADTGVNANPDYTQEPQKGIYWQVDHPANKCDMCLPLIKKGEKPTCVATCPQRALDWGPIDMLKSTYPDAVDYVEINVNGANIYADPSETHPSVIFKAKTRI